MRTKRQLLIGCVASAILPGLAAGKARSVRDDEFVSLGGIDQWITIRGSERANPVILVAHGGPAEVQWPFTDRYAGWERRFIVVQWDQRGAGKTFGRNGTATPGIDLSHIADDGVELADLLAKRFGKRRIIVLGHSWGTLVASRMAQIKPERFAAYVGTGQATSWKNTVNAQFDFLLSRARTSDAALAKSLETIGRPDYTNFAQYAVWSRPIRSQWPAADQAWVGAMKDRVANAPGMTAQDLEALNKGADFSIPKLLPDLIASDLPTTARRFQMPHFVIQGREDIVTPTSVAIDYERAVEAPAKAMTLIDGAGHFAYATHPEAFVAALESKVRPAAIAHGA